MTEHSDWLLLLNARYAAGWLDAEAGMYDPPYPGSDDPQELDENRAYKQGFDRSRKELGDSFKWK